MDFTENTIQTETKNLRALQSQLKQLQKMKQAVNAEINAYKVQYSTHGNLLLLPKTQIKHLEMARTDNRIASENVKSSIDHFKEKAESTRINQEQTENQITLNKEQRESLKAVKGNNKDVINIIKKLAKLLSILAAKLDVLKKIQNIHLDSLNHFENILSKLEELSGIFDQQVNLRKRQSLFSRTPSPFVLLDGKNLIHELNNLSESAKQLLKKERWLKELRTDWKSGRALLLSLFLIFCLFQFVLMRLRKYLGVYCEHGSVEKTKFLKIILEITKQSFYFMGLTVFIYFYANLSGLYSTIPFVRLIVLILSIVLFTQWGHSFLTFWLHSYPWLPKKSIHLLHRLISFARYYSILYILIDWIIMDSSTLLFFGRILMEIFLLIWAFAFLNKYKTAHQGSDIMPSKLYRRILFISLIVYGVVGIGIGMELLAYGTLSTYWYASWGISLIVIALSSLLFLVLQEVRQASKEKIKNDDEASSKPVYLIRWLFLQLAWFFWLVSSILMLVTTWGGQQTVISNFFTILTKTFTIGSIKISLMNFVYAFIILGMTQTIARFFRYFLKEKILSGSGMDKGLQDSITMISIYSFWAFGIILSLHVFGFGTTSLAVGFGALGIGLGFGLQNIFNNFVSGIIMLIERPIQIGDDVEINGTLATVKKINVRSTVVQTYDNASLYSQFGICQSAGKKLEF
ncbi:MAG: mechanosensitive ion channel [Desulfobacula sp.]|nr:mechanosensitive ion channel [Desulfobacula sp.]